MTEESHDTKIALLNERVNGLIADKKALRADIAELKLERSQSSAQRDRNIRWLAYVLGIAVTTNVIGPESAMKLLMTIIGGR